MECLGDKLVEMLKESRQDCVLAAPYIKQRTLATLFEAIDPCCNVRVVTRWRIEEIAVGVTDLEIWTLIRNRRNSELWLQPNLHAKYYRADDKILIGSANISDTALGWSSNPNLEILEHAPTGEFSRSKFEKVLLQGVTPVTPALFESFQLALADFPKQEQYSKSVIVEVASSIMDWRPSLRFPADLFLFYSGSGDDLSSSTRLAAANDLASLQPPVGLQSFAFKRWIGLALLQNREFNQIDEFVQSSRRFGEMRSFLASQGCEDPSRDWQTWMRWISHFLPNHFTFHTANYSEIVSRPK